MKILRFISPALLALSLTTLPGCHTQPTPEQQASTAEKTMLASHDTLMGRMDALYDVRKQLLATPGLDTATAGHHSRALQAADAAMMDWMHQYKRPADSVALPRKLAYFATQQRRIDSVAHLMTLSLDSARQVLKQAASLPKPSAQ